MPTRIEVNCETGEVQEIELTAKEIAEMDKAAAEAQAALEAAEAEAKAKEEAKTSAQAKLAKLGLTADEISAFFG